jgi:hypothetical protein
MYQRARATTITATAIATIAMVEAATGTCPRLPPSVAAKLSGEWHGARSGERLREHREDAEVSMQGDPFAATETKRSKPVLVLQAPEGPLDG